jgi:hypothetical protein
MFEAIHKVNMNANLGLIVNCYHFITTNNKEFFSMNSFFSCGEDNAIHTQKEKGQYVTNTFRTTCYYLVFATKFCPLGLM